MAGIDKQRDATSLADIEEVLVCGALRATGGNISKTARLLSLR